MVARLGNISALKLYGSRRCCEGRTCSACAPFDCTCSAVTDSGTHQLCSGHRVVCVSGRCRATSHTCPAVVRPAQVWPKAAFELKAPLRSAGGVALVVSSIVVAPFDYVARL